MQAQPTNLLNSLWITANAGSGKTTVLTDRVVTLLLYGVMPERICCITYTKAAAGEMRYRVLERLRMLFLASEEDCRAVVERLLGAAPDAAHIARARGLFGRVLDSTSGGVQFTTIHGFCQQVLRLFPLEAGVAPHFTVLEEAAADGLLRRVSHRLLTAVDGVDATLAAVLSLIGERSGEARFDAIIGDIAKKRSQWVGVWQNQTPELLCQRLWRAHGLHDGVTDADILVALCDCITPNEVAVLRAHVPQLIAHKTKREQRLGAVLAQWLETPVDARAVPLNEFVLLFLKQDGDRRKDIIGDKEFPVGTPLRDAIEAIAARVVALVEQRSALACAEESFAVAVIARAFLDLYAQAKDMARALDYDDLIVKTRELFAQPEMLPWVMSKLDHRIDHLLVDEAQDTSAEQWPMVDALVEELIAASEGIGSGDVPRSLLVVGDEKQSIYSFQGAAPEMFAAKQSEIRATLQHSISPLRTRLLDISYRSSKAVLDLVNHVASMPEVAPALSAEGISAPHRCHRGTVGRVVLYPPMMKPEKEHFPSLTMPKEYLVTRSASQMLAEDVASRVDGWLQSGRVVESTGKPITPGDILILVHRRAPMMLPLIRALQRRNIPVAGLDRLTLSTHLAVRDLLALMAWCVNPADDLALAQVLRSPIIGISDEALRSIAYGREGSLWAAVSVLDETAHATLGRWLMMQQTSPYDFLTDVLEVCGCRRAFATRFGGEVHEVLDELKAQATAMPAEMMATLAHFVDWIAGSNRQIKREQENASVNQVRMMTVHGAKGLEAPVVLLVDTVSVPTTQKEIIYTARDAHGQMFPAVALTDAAKGAAVLVQAKEKKSAAMQAEYQRLLYVALTRPRDELHVFGIAEKSGAVRAGSWYQRVAGSMDALGARDEDGAKVVGGVVGSPPIKLPKQFSSPVRGELKSLPAWASAAAAVDQAVRMVSPSALAPVEVSPYVQGSARGARERGVRIHRVLEALTAASDMVMIARLVAHVAPDWSAEEQAQAVAEITALHTAHRWLWEHRVQAEASVCGVIDIGGASVPVHGQMDLLVETPEALIILDYKTGRHVPARAADVSASYLLQLKTYRAVMAQIYPGKPIRCAILWTHGPSLMWLDDVVAAVAWPVMEAG